MSTPTLNCLSQSKNPNINLLAQEIEILLRAFAANFIQANILDEATAADLYEQTFIQAIKDTPKLGLQTERRLNELMEGGEITQQEQKEFKRGVYAT